MPAKVTKAGMIIHICEVCRKPAYFGFGVSLNKALIMATKGKIELAKELLGKWYCYEHKDN